MVTNGSPMAELNKVPKINFEVSIIHNNQIDAHFTKNILHLYDCQDQHTYQLHYSYYHIILLWGDLQEVICNYEALSRNLTYNNIQIKFDT